MIRALAISLMLAFAPISGTAQAETLRIGTESGYPPYMSLDRAGNLHGFEKDMGDAICAILQADCIWTDAAFGSLLPDLAAGQYDMVIAALSTTPERSRSVAFSVPYFGGGINIGVFAGLNPNQAIEGARIGVQEGTIQADHLTKTRRNAVPFRSVEDAFAALMRREVDLVLSNDVVIRNAQEGRFPGLRVVANEEIQGWDTAIAIAKGNDTLRLRIDAAMMQLLESGAIAELEARWFVSGTTI